MRLPQSGRSETELILHLERRSKTHGRSGRAASNIDEVYTLIAALERSET